MIPGNKRWGKEEPRMAEEGPAGDTKGTGDAQTVKTWLGDLGRVSG